MEDWPIRPLIRGDWKNLPLADAVDLLARAVWYEHEEGLAESSPEVDYRRVRAMPLSCLPGWFLAEAEARFPDGCVGYKPLLVGRDCGLRIPDGTTGAVLNAFSFAGMPELTDAQEDQYLELYICLARGPLGRFQVIRSLDDLDLADGYAIEGAEDFADAILPRCWRPEDRSGIWCTMAYGRGIFNTRLARQRNGEVTMEEDELISEQALRRETFRECFRIPLGEPCERPEALTEEAAGSGDDPGGSADSEDE